MFHKSLIVNCFKLSQLAIKTLQSHYSPWCTCQLGIFSRLSDGSFWLQVTMKTAKKWHKKCIFPILITLTHMYSWRKKHEVGSVFDLLENCMFTILWKNRYQRNRKQKPHTLNKFGLQALWMTKLLSYCNDIQCGQKQRFQDFL